MKIRKYILFISIVTTAVMVLSACGASVDREASPTPGVTAPDESPQPESSDISGRVLEIESGRILIRNEDDTSLYYYLQTGGSIEFAQGIEGPVEHDNVIKAKVLITDGESLPIEARLLEITSNVSPSYTVINAEQAKEMIDEGDTVIIDVRTIPEYGDGHIPDSYNVPLDEISQGIDRITADREAIILIYCKSGNRSKIAARIITELGYTNVYDFGGIVDWPYEIVN